jgi:hypothetical protein
MLRVSGLNDVAASKITKRLDVVLKYNERRLKIEKLFRDNGFEVDFMKGQLDPKMANLFPNLGVNILEQMAKSLADNPWIDEVNLFATTGSFKPFRDAVDAQVKIMNMLCGAVRDFSKIAPQPSEEELKAFQEAVTAEDLPEGTHWITSQGRIGTFDAPLDSFIVDGLFHHPHVIFPRGNNISHHVRLSSLEAAIAVREQMQEMMERALEADREREEKRKMPAE